MTPSVLESLSSTGGLRPCAGRVVDRDESGGVRVRWQGMSGPARLASVASHVPVSDLVIDAELLLFVDPSGTARPIVLAVLNQATSTARHSGEAAELESDGERLEIVAQREIVLRCGHSSLTLRRDGKIVVRGKEILSRASRSNKIKGASVAIN